MAHSLGASGAAQGSRREHREKDKVDPSTESLPLHSPLLQVQQVLCTRAGTGIGKKMRLAKH
eukprot:1158193-Pelagomonas_calceolata.AAC.3